MTFEVGRLSAALTLDGVPEFHRGLDDAGRKLQDTGQRGASFGKLGEQAIRSAAGATTGLVAAAGSYLAILTKTGVGYNSLQQNSRAALSVMLGGAEQANAQMDKLDAFARESPFAKQVFIQAQQQMLGFGIEASKVIPYLDAIQQSVAATGGTNDDISGLVEIMSKIQSSAKITAEDLNMFGGRGVNAAQLIGDQMGKTASQIRDEISAGSLDATEALDALAAGMVTTYGGATALVKQQWSGAVDRIKGANRDIGAAIAEPFVSAQGGGMAVTWGNQVADVLRAIEKQAVPVMGILTQRGMPFFSALTQGLDSAAQATARWDAESLNVTLDKMANHAPGIAALAGATLALGTQVGPLGRMFSVLGFSANPVLAAFVGLAAASPEVRDSLMGIVRAGEPLLPVVTDLAGILSGTLNAALPVVAGGLDAVASVLEIVFGIISKIPAPVLAAGAAFMLVHKALGPIGNLATTATTGMTGLVKTFQDTSARAYAGGLSQASANMAGINAAAAPATGAVRGLGNALKTAFLSNPIGIALTVISVAISAWAMANAAAQQKVQEHQTRVAELKGTLHEASGALTEASKSMLGQVVATDEMAAALKGTGVSGQAFVTALTESGTAAKLFESDVMKSARSMEAYEKYSGNWEATANKLGVSLDTLVRSSLGFTDAQAEVDDALSRSGGSFTALQDDLDNTTRGIQSHLSNQHEVVSAYEAQRTAIDEAQREQARYREATREAAAAMTDAARSNQAFNDALSVARDTTQDAETRVRALKQALDELSGGAISAEEAEKRLSEANLSLAEGLAQTGQEGEKLWQATLDGSGNIDIASRSGLAFADTMGQARDRMLDAAMAASDQALATGDIEGAVTAAKAAGDGYIETLRQTMSEAGLTQEQIDGLIGKYLDVPSTVATLLTSNGTISETDQQLIALAQQIDATPDKEVTITEPMSPKVKKRLEDLGYTVENLPDGTVNVKESGSASVENTINHVARNRTATITIDSVVGGRGVMDSNTPSGSSARGNLFSGGQAEAFAQGGIPSGFYKAPPGMPAIHKFAENFLPWEAYISPLPGAEERNARIAMEALERLGHPVIPVSALRGVPAFAAGGTVGRPTPPMSAQNKPVQVERQHARRGPLANTINVGVNASTNDVRNLATILDRLSRR